jgi:hypothetical protein
MHFRPVLEHLGAVLGRRQATPPSSNSRNGASAQTLRAVANIDAQLKRTKLQSKSASGWINQRKKPSAHRRVSSTGRWVSRTVAVARSMSHGFLSAKNSGFPFTLEIDVAALKGIRNVALGWFAVGRRGRAHSMSPGCRQLLNVSGRDLICRVISWHIVGSAFMPTELSAIAVECLMSVREKDLPRN